jgi:hypothetical protein
METKSRNPEKLLYGLVIFLLLGFAVSGVAVDGIAETVRGLWAVQIHPARLVSDFTEVGGSGAALVNASLVALVGLALVRITGVRLSGPTVAAVFTMFGFGLFGKTPLNILPLILGVAASARIAGRRLREYLLIAMFGTALAPLVTLLVVESALPMAIRLPTAALAGFAVGLVFPAIAMSMLRLHQGYNLYNVGLASGFLAFFVAAVLFGVGGVPDLPLVWNESPSLLLRLLVPVTSGLMGVAALVAGRMEALRSFGRIMRLPGRLPSDFMDIETVSGALVNTAVMGLLMWLFVLVVGADLNGPVLGAIFTVMGFASFGKHPRNASPVVAGVVIAALVYGQDLASPGVILGALFVTTLAPLAGDFGPIIGVIAGFLHLSIVLRSGAWHAGVSLYNNGLAGGLTAGLLVSVIEWYRSITPFAQHRARKKRAGGGRVKERN